MTDYRLPNPTTMNLWSTTNTDDNASMMMDAFMSSDLTSSYWPPATPQQIPHQSSSSASAAAATFNQESLQHRLQSLIETAKESWTYAIFWQSSVVDYSSPPQSLLGWGDGYYEGEDKEKQLSKRNITSAAEQDHRKKVLRELDSLISGNQPSPDDAVDEEVTDTEWFFLVSMTQSFVNGSGLPGQAFYDSAVVWITGAERLASSHCERARQGQTFGLQTIVCIPSNGGVVELGSTDMIFQSSDLMNKVRILFNFNSIEAGSWDLPTEPNESDPSAFWLTDPSPAPSIEMKEIPSANSKQPQIMYENHSSSTLTENPRELNFSSGFGFDGISSSNDRNGNSGSHACKPESGELLNFGESKRSCSSGAGNLFSGHSTLVGGVEDNNNKKRCPNSRGSHEEGMLSFTSGVILPSSGAVKSGGGGDAISFINELKSKLQTAGSEKDELKSQLESMKQELASKDQQDRKMSSNHHGTKLLDLDIDVKIIGWDAMIRIQSNKKNHPAARLMAAL